MLGIDWSVQEEAFAGAYIEFLENLVSAHAFYVSSIMTCIARNFQFRKYRLIIWNGVTCKITYMFYRSALTAVRQG